MNDSKELWLSVDQDNKYDRLLMGRYISHSYMTDPIRLSFSASRYKFCAKMLKGLGSVLEIGCADGFFAPFVAAGVGKLVCTDINDKMIQDCRESGLEEFNIDFVYHDFRAQPWPEKVDGIYLVDVLEHIFPEEENGFLNNMTASVNEWGVALIGTPNVTAKAYASPGSEKGHVNLKGQQELKELAEKHFHRVFLFGQNDEVVHTGFGPMCHYLWALCVGPKIG